MMENNQTTHGKSKTPEYRVWAGIMQRCYNESMKRYDDYGGRGIMVCEKWHKFENFYCDMGDRPSKNYSIDRINNDSNYEPSNCRWATRSQQQKNRRPVRADNKMKRGDDHWTRKNPKKAKLIAQKNIKKAHGCLEKNPNAKLTIEIANRMREYFLANPGLRMIDLGSIFCVGRETARKVIKGVSWK